MFSQTVEYALRAVVAIAQLEAGEHCTSRRIAEITKVPSAYLSKLMQALVRGGIVVSLRGRHGGFALAKPADELTILDVIQVIEPIKRIHRCPLELPSHSGQLCPLHSRLDKAIEAVECVFTQTTLAEVLSNASGIKPLCQNDGSHRDTEE